MEKHYKKSNKPLFRQIMFIVIAIILILAVCVGVYAYSLISGAQVITIGVGETYTLKTDTKDCVVRSYHADVVSPSHGTSVVSNTLGEAIVCAKYTYFNRDFYRFKVISAPTKVKLSTSELHLGKGESYTLSSECKVGDHEFDTSYSSSDDSVATVDNSGVVRALGVGECTISAAAYNGIKATCKIYVSDEPAQLSLSYSDITLGVSETKALTPVFNDNEYSSTITYTTSDASIASVKDGVISAHAVGECTIKATTHNSKEAQCKVKVMKMPDSISIVTLDKYSLGSDIDVIIGMPSDCTANDISISVSDSSVLSIDEENPMLVHCIKEGTANITATLKNSVSATKAITVSNYQGNSIQDFNILNQYPTLPTGCEVVSLTSVLNYYGMKVSMTTMADEYMPRLEYNYYTGNPNKNFLGDPYTRDGFGCYPPCLVTTAENYFADNNIEDYIAVNITGCTTTEFFDYIENGVPVITWVTTGFVSTEDGGSWIADDGEEIYWCNHEHCLVTTGYNKSSNTVTVADDNGGYSYTVSLSRFQSVFEDMGSKAVVILKK